MVAVNDRMRAVLIRGFGGVEVLEYAEVPRPVPRADEALIEVHAASVNPRDWMIREGRYPFQWLLPRLPFVLGSDLSGVVVDVGRRVTQFQPGNEVFAMQPSSRGFGAYAELVAVAETALAIKPATMTHEEAAGAPLAALTALQALRDKAQLRARQHVLIVGASGGVGSYAVQIAKILGAEVTGVASGRNLEMVRSLGADRVIDRQLESFLAEDSLYDAIFDVVGKESLAGCAHLLCQGGIYVTTIPRPPAFREQILSTLAAGLRLRSTRSSVVMVRSHGSNLAEIAKWIEEGQIRTQIDRVFPLAEAAAAHTQSRTFRSRGKLILKVR